jgi:molybdopterin molybdotransferase
VKQVESLLDLVAAWERLAAALQPLGSERVPLAAASGRVLAMTVRTDRDQPPFDRAAMDGYAVCAAVLAGASSAAPVRLRVVGEALPGAPWQGDAGLAAVRIMTGAPVPAGCDTIVPVEQTSGFGAGDVEVRVALPPGKHIVRRAEERRGGETILSPGQRLRGADVGMLAALGVAQVEVGRQPRVAVLQTGSELVAADATPAPAQIRDANGALLAALAAPHAASLVMLGIVPDSEAEIRTRLVQGLEQDLLLVSGGVSMGAYDLVTPVLEALGVHIHFRRVAIQPGKPTVFGTHARGCVVALPGNPVSALTAYRLFAAAALRRLEGETELRPHWESLQAEFAWQRTHSRWLFVPGRRTATGVERVPYAGSGDLLAFARADGQIVLPPERARVVAGEPVAFWPL